MVNNNCIKCLNNIDGNVDYFECDFCKGRIHKGCIGLSTTEERVMPLRKRLLILVCDNCKNVMKKVSTLLNMFETFKDEMSEIKQFMKNINDKEIFNSKEDDESYDSSVITSQKKLYSQVTSTNKKEVLIVKPREEKPINEIRKQLAERVDPVHLNVEVEIGKNLKNGGVILECRNKEEAKTVLNSIENDLGDIFTVKQPKKVHPKMKIVRVPKNLANEDVFKEKLIKQNKIPENEGFHLQIVHISKETQEDYVNVLIEVDSRTFGLLNNKEYINISLFRCKIYEFVSIVKCYKCQRYNHFASECKEQSNICPKCGENHKENECKSKKFKCTNCIRANEKFNLKLNIDHVVWDRSCQCLLKVEEIKKKKTNYL